ncbi:hypothetical protein H4R18_004316 [Coemansia javaensis]|uniref:Uncharacterized protein n=1 Tax=Coemansia javaensis TaxID=2761396 RepID=A0A9W8HCM0_9FUNG|nr:hypothetical protein H4R18_004316 [Coemansia javaensis]
MKLLVPLSAAVAAAVAVVQAASPTLYVFGDSLSDIGTLRELTLGLVPPPPYWRGRFSSGPVWNEYLAPLLSYGLYNKAVGGATSDNANASVLKLVPFMPIDLPSAQNQISYFRAIKPFYSSSPTRNDDIAVLEIGANDFFAEMFKLAAGQLTPGSFVETLSTTVIKQLEQLRTIGFKNFIIADLAAIQHTPMAKLLKIEAVSAATVTQYNQVLAAKVAAWAGSAKGLGFYGIAPLGKFVEVTALSANVSQALGLADVSTSCVGGNALNLIQAQNKLVALMNFVVNADSNLMCTNPSTNYFFDVVHPAERVQRLFGYYAKHLVDALRQGATFDMTEANMLALIKQHSLNTPAPKPAKV